MGYNTNYSLDVFGPKIENFLEILNEITGYSWYDSFELIDAKWHKHEEHMKILSARFPVNSFELEGVGEDYPDIWKLYAKNGQIYRARAIITYPPVPMFFLI